VSDNELLPRHALIPPSYETAAVTVDVLLYFTLEWTREIDTTLYQARHPL